MIVVRKLLDYVFTKKELQVLDDILPAFKRHDRLDDEEALQQLLISANTILMLPAGILQTEEDADRRASASLHYTNSNIEVSMANGKIIKIPHDLVEQPEINITEEMNKSGMWKSLEPQNGKEMKTKEGPKKKHSERKMSLVKETPEEDSSITTKTESQKNKNEVGSEEETKSLVNSETSV